MRFEDFSLVLRGRGGWEALDLGMVIARRWRRAALAAWFATYAPLGLLFSPLVFVAPFWGLLAFWWLKPFFDRILLYIYSRAVFGDVPTLRDALRAGREALLSPSLWADLSYRRFSPSRSFDMPISVLEGQSGRRRSERIGILGARTHGYASWLTFACANFVVVLEWMVMAGFGMLLPIGIASPRWFEISESGVHVEGWMGVAVLAAMMIADTLVEPLYVAAGFSLYLNRRSQLEGWDLELTFRRMRARLGHVAPSGALFALICAAFLGLAAPPSIAHAGTAILTSGANANGEAGVLPVLVPKTADTSPEKSVAAAMRGVRSDPAFGHDETRWAWHYRASLTPQNRPTLELSWLAALVHFLATVFEWGGRVLVALILLAILRLVLRAWPKARAIRPQGGVRPERIPGVDVRHDTLPDDVVAAARRHIASGEVSQAISLLYRACLVQLIDRAHIEFAPGDTEEKCIARVTDRIRPGACAYFIDLVEAWRACAYAHRTLSSAQVATLCDEWSAHFGSGRTLQAGES